MKKVFKAPIIFSLFAATVFSIIGSEPARSNPFYGNHGNKSVKYQFGNCKLHKYTKNWLEVKSFGNVIYEPASTSEGKNWMRNSEQCKK